MIRTLGLGAAGVFLLALMASGISSSVVGTLAGQVIMQGFLGFAVPVWVRRLVTMVPAFVIALYVETTKAMVMSQIVLSLVLPLPLIALIVMSSRKSVMGDFVIGRLPLVMAVTTTLLIVAMNIALIKAAIF
jgi:manganese transport protein